MVLDALAEKISGGKLAYDKGGAMARAGSVNEALLKELLAHPYFQRSPPKSTGREEFGSDFALSLFEKGVARALNSNDIFATATMLTARSIATSIRQRVAESGDVLAFNIIVAGGGVRNDCLMSMLSHELGDIGFWLSESFGIPAQFRECAAFAILARETMLGRCSNLPGATGARAPRILGCITP